MSVPESWEQYKNALPERLLNTLGREPCAVG